MTLLVTCVFWDEVKVLAANDEGTVHLGRDDGSGQDTATNRDQAGKRALLVCNRMKSVIVDICPTESAFHRRSFHTCTLVCARARSLGLRPRAAKSRREGSMPHTDVASVNCSLWCLESQTDILEPSPSTLSDSLGLSGLELRVEEDVWLLLVSALALYSQFGRHDCRY